MTTEKKLIVVKSNKLIEASYRLDLIEQRIILAAIDEARDTQKGLGDGFITLEAKRFAKMFNMDDARVYSQLKEAMLSLYRREVTIHDIHPESGHDRTTLMRWISSASYINGAGSIQIRFAPEMVPYITRLECEFTSYRLEKIGRMSSAHAVRLYELLVQYLNIGQREIEIAWLREVLQLEIEYKAIKDFKKRVLDVAVDQINEYSDIRVSYTQRKTGRTVTHLIFEIKPEPVAKAEKPGEASKRVVIDDAFLAKHARPGESRDQAYRRLMEEHGQTRLVA